MSKYTSLIHKESGSDYGVSFPDFPGCVTVGVTLDEARRKAVEALALHIDGMIDDGEAIPEPTSLEAVMSQRENRDAVAFLVSVGNACPARATKDNKS
jgi:predicted RNase H-like HicB family nuclease